MMNKNFSEWNKHATTIIGFHPSFVAQRIAKLRYDAMLLFFNALAKQIAEDAKADLGRNRPQLANRLDKISKKVQDLASDVDDLVKWHQRLGIAP